MQNTTMVTPISLEIFRSALTAIAEEMGTVLMLSSYSPNIKERRDFSCALFDAQGRLVAQAAHIPVHLGAMPDSVASALVAFEHFAPGDIIALNDPFLGGSHLPDITLIAPIFSELDGEQRLIGFAANRAHHADVGGMSPGSMPLATEIYQEGLIIPPIKLWEAGQPNQPLLSLILRNIRTPEERRGDLAAQVAANRTAAQRMQELIERWGFPMVETHIDALIEYAQRITEATIAAIPDGNYQFTDSLDDDGMSDEPVSISATVTVRGSQITVDFSGSSPQTRGNVNAVAAVAKSATYYV
ncbi:MAG: hydantoinase B/oxoprolinase family protein, partial [Chloroflexota bacterium]|nr:hydantoinase B/oxoprolinase family protein [Chloroflexota bacterium]